MVRIGRPPHVYLIEGHNDMSHFTPSEYVCNEFVYVTDELYMKLLQFTDPTLIEGTQTEKEEMKSALESSAVKSLGPGESSADNLMTFLSGTSLAQRIKRAIDMNPGKSMLWQFNGLGPNMKDQYRHVVAMGDPSLLHVWTDFEAYVILPLHRMRVKALNRMIRRRQQREIASWEAYLKEVYSRRENETANP